MITGRRLDDGYEDLKVVFYRNLPLDDIINSSSKNLLNGEDLNELISSNAADVSSLRYTKTNEVSFKVSKGIPSSASNSSSLLTGKLTVHIESKKSVDKKINHNEQSQTSISKQFKSLSYLGKHILPTEEERSRRAAAWLLNEKELEEQKYVEKKNYLDSVKELEMKRRYKMNEESHRKMQEQLTLLQMDLQLNTMSPTDATMNQFDMENVEPNKTQPIRMSLHPTVPRLSKQHLKGIIPQILSSPSKIVKPVQTNPLRSIKNQTKPTIKVKDMSDDDDEDDNLNGRHSETAAIIAEKLTRTIPKEAHRFKSEPTKKKEEKSSEEIERLQKLKEKREAVVKQQQTAYQKKERDAKKKQFEEKKRKEEALQNLRKTALQSIHRGPLRLEPNSVTNKVSLQPKVSQSSFKPRNLNQYPEEIDHQSSKPPERSRMDDLNFRTAYDEDEASPYYSVPTSPEKAFLKDYGWHGSESDDNPLDMIRDDIGIKTYDEYSAVHPQFDGLLSRTIPTNRILPRPDTNRSSPSSFDRSKEYQNRSFHQDNPPIPSKAVSMEPDAIDYQAFERMIPYDPPTSQPTATSHPDYESRRSATKLASSNHHPLSGSRESAMKMEEVKQTLVEVDRIRRLLEQQTSNIESAFHFKLLQQSLTRPVDKSEVTTEQDVGQPSQEIEEEEKEEAENQDSYPIRRKLNIPTFNHSIQSHPSESVSHSFPTIQPTMVPADYRSSRDSTPPLDLYPLQPKPPLPQKESKKVDLTHRIDTKMPAVSMTMKPVYTRSSRNAFDELEEFDSVLRVASEDDHSDDGLHGSDQQQKGLKGTESRPSPQSKHRYSGEIEDQEEGVARIRRYDETEWKIPVQDPFLKQQLGLLADRRAIVSQYTKDLDEGPTMEMIFDDPYHDHDHPIQFEENPSVRVPMKPMIPSNNSYKNQNYIPSLNNVGELATLLQLQDSPDPYQDTRAEVSEEEEDEEDYSVLSIYAKEIFKSRQKERPRSDVRTGTDPDVSFPVDRTNETFRERDEIANIFSEVRKELGNEIEQPIESEDNTVPEKEDPTEESVLFWNSLLNRRWSHHHDAFVVDNPLKVPTNRHDSPLPPSVELVPMPDPDQHELIFDMNVMATASRHPQEEPRPPEQSSKAPPVTIRYTAAEMRVRMIEELTRQDEIFGYALELAEAEKLNTINSARELTMETRKQSEQAIARMRHLQELETQRLAYEQSLVITAAQHHLAMEKQQFEQQNQLNILHNQMKNEQTRQEVDNIITHANHFASNVLLSHSIVNAENEILQQETRQSLIQQEEKSQFEMNLLRQSHEHQQKLLLQQEELLRYSNDRTRETRDPRKSQEASIQDSVRKAPETSRKVIDESTNSYAPDFTEDSVMMNEDDPNYSMTFDQEASRSHTAILHKSTRSVPEAISEVVYDEEEDRVRMEGDGDSSKQPMIRSEVSSVKSIESSFENKRSSQQQTNPRRNQPVQGEKTTGYDYSNDEVSDDYVQDTFHESTSQEVSKSQKIFEESLPTLGSSAWQDVKNRKIMDRRVTEESQSILSLDESTKPMTVADRTVTSNSVDEVPSQEDPSNYSETFEDASQNVDPSIQSKVGATQRVSSTFQPVSSYVMPPSIAAMNDKDEEYIDQILSHYRQEMELRLQGQERSYQMRSQLIDSNKDQSLQTLQKMVESKEISKEKAIGIQQRIHDQHREQRILLEKEKWSINANIYKEFKKFRKLQKELRRYDEKIFDGKDSGSSLEIPPKEGRLQKSGPRSLLESEVSSSSDDSRSDSIPRKKTNRAIDLKATKDRVKSNPTKVKTGLKAKGKVVARDFDLVEENSIVEEKDESEAASVVGDSSYGEMAKYEVDSEEESSEEEVEVEEEPDEEEDDDDYDEVFDAYEVASRASSRSKTSRRMRCDPVEVREENSIEELDQVMDQVMDHEIPDESEEVVGGTVMEESRRYEDSFIADEDHPFMEDAGLSSSQVYTEPHSSSMSMRGTSQSVRRDRGLDSVVESTRYEEEFEEDEPNPLQQQEEETSIHEESYKSNTFDDEEEEEENEDDDRNENSVLLHTLQAIPGESRMEEGETMKRDLEEDGADPSYDDSFAMSAASVTLHTIPREVETDLEKGQEVMPRAVDVQPTVGKAVSIDKEDPPEASSIVSEVEVDEMLDAAEPDDGLEDSYYSMGQSSRRDVPLDSTQKEGVKLDTMPSVMRETERSKEMTCSKEEEEEGEEEQEADEYDDEFDELEEEQPKIEVQQAAKDDEFEDEIDEDIEEDQEDESEVSSKEKQGEEIDSRLAMSRLVSTISEPEYDFNNVDQLMKDSTNPAVSLPNDTTEGIAIVTSSTGEFNNTASSSNSVTSSDYGRDFMFSGSLDEALHIPTMLNKIGRRGGQTHVPTLESIPSTNERYTSDLNSASAVATPHESNQVAITDTFDDLEPASGAIRMISRRTSQESHDSGLTNQAIHSTTSRSGSSSTSSHTASVVANGMVFDEIKQEWVGGGVDVGIFDQSSEDEMESSSHPMNESSYHYGMDRELKEDVPTNDEGCIVEELDVDGGVDEKGMDYVEVAKYPSASLISKNIEKDSIHGTTKDEDELDFLNEILGDDAMDEKVTKLCDQLGDKEEDKTETRRQEDIMMAEEMTDDILSGMIQDTIARYLSTLDRPDKEVAQVTSRLPLIQLPIETAEDEDDLYEFNGRDVDVSPGAMVDTPRSQEIEPFHDELMIRQQIGAFIEQSTQAFVVEVMKKVDEKQLIQRIRDPSYQDPILSMEDMPSSSSFRTPLGQQPFHVRDDYTYGTIHPQAVFDRMNEILDEIHHFQSPSSRPVGNVKLSKRFLLEHIPMRKEAIMEYIHREMAHDVHDVKELILGNKSEFELLRIDLIDTFREEMKDQIDQSGQLISDTIISKILNETVMDVTGSMR